MKNTEGFTLVELVMILVIAGIILAIAIMPKTTARVSIKLEAACQRIASDLRYVQEMAIAEQVRYGISFDPVNESYFAYRLNTSNKATDPLSRSNLEIGFNQANEFKGIDITSTNFSNKIEFDSVGAPYDGNGIILTSQGIVTLQSSDGLYSKTVRIEPKTGKVGVQ